MAFLSFDSAFQNVLTIVIIFVVFYFIYKNMREGRMKQAIKDGFQKIKIKKEE